MANFSLSSFDSTTAIVAKVVRPESYRNLLEELTNNEPVIARGAGLSYAPASFGADAVSIDVTRFDRILGYDESAAVVEVEPGLSIGTLARFLATRGRYLPAMPGYPAITIGGCMAFDVHGKSQFHSGNFAEWVESFELHHKDHGTLRCSREQNAELFALTLGGAGLTGVIVSARLKTTALPGPGVEVRSVPVRNLLDAADTLRKHAGDAACLYSWNDLNRGGRHFGAGVVYVERFTDTLAEPKEPRARMDIGTRWPFSIWTRPSTAFVMRMYGRLQRAAEPVVLPMQAALFPILGKEHYYAGFGPRGFREYQLIVPFERWAAFVDSLSRLLDRFALPITLGSLKLFRGDSKFVRFCGDGVCLALDVPATVRSAMLFDEIDQLAIATSSIVNLCKDSRLSSATCAKVFAEYDVFRSELARFDPKQHYRSRLRTQVGV